MSIESTFDLDTGALIYENSDYERLLVHKVPIEVEACGDSMARAYSSRLQLDLLDLRRQSAAPSRHLIPVIGIAFGLDLRRVPV